MTILLSNELLADFPAFSYYAAMSRNTIIETGREFHAAFVKDGDVFAIPFQSRSHGMLHHHFKFGSVIGAACRDHSCPERAIAQARLQGHSLRFAYGLGACISNTPVKKKDMAVLNFGDHILFEGKIFELEKAPNDNVNLKEIEI